MLALTLPLLIAPFVGSFLGVLILRLPENDPVVLTRSMCADCGTQLGPLDLVPLASFALQHGRCRHCGQPIRWFYPAVELAAIGVSVWATLASQTQHQAWAGCLLGWTLLTLSWIDCLWLLLPDLLTLTLILAGLLIAIATSPDDVFWHALGVAGGYLGLRGVAAAYHLLRHREGLGEGDAKLLAAAGAWLGIWALPWLVLFAALAALAWAGLAAAAGRSINATTALPFGPFLAASFWLLWLYGSAWGLT